MTRNNDTHRTYRRRMIRQLPILGEKGQKKISQTRLTVVGCGGTGSRFIELSSLAGFLKITAIDFDPLEMSNRNRFALGGVKDVGKPKVVIVKQKLEKRFPDVRIRALVADARSPGIWEQASQADWLIDATDSEDTRRSLSRKCAEDQIPVISLGVGYNFQEGKLVRAGCRANRVGPGDPCLACQVLVEGRPEVRTRASLATANAIVAGLGLELLLREVTGYSGRASLDEQGIDRNGTLDGQPAARDVNFLFFDLLNWSLAAERLLPTAGCPDCEWLASWAKEPQPAAGTTESGTEEPAGHEIPF